MFVCNSFSTLTALSCSENVAPVVLKCLCVVHVCGAEMGKKLSVDALAVPHLVECSDVYTAAQLACQILYLNKLFVQCSLYYLICLNWSHDALNTKLIKALLATHTLRNVLRTRAMCLCLSPSILCVPATLCTCNHGYVTLTERPTYWPCVIVSF